MKKKITIIVGTMIQGGAQRIPCMQANELVKRGHDVTILLVVDSPIRPFFIDAAVKVEHCMPYERLDVSNFTSKLRRRLLGAFYIRKALIKIVPDIVISHVQGTNREAILACKMLGIKIIVCEHTSIHMPYGLMGKLAYLERRFIYKMADAITVLTKYDHDTFYSKYHKNVIVLPNPTSFTPKYEIPQGLRYKNITAIGDLNRINVKGWDLLIPIFAEVAKNNPHWRLQIAGGGEEGREILTKLTKQHNISTKVDFLGSVKEVDKLLQRSSIFILTSRNEGMPMALLEAMSQGCACIAFDCKTGPGDLIINNENGLLIPDGNTKKMIVDLHKLVSSDALRSRLGLAAVKTIDNYSIANITNMLENIINTSLCSSCK